MLGFKLGSTYAILVALSATSALPVQKRIAQVITDSTSDWEQACLAAGGGQSCNPLSVAAFSTLLAAPDPCAQQDAADNMIDLAKQLGEDSEMIRLTQLFRQQPRNAPDSLSVLYCQTPSRNNELAGLFQCQFSGVNPKVFTGGLAVGAPGTIPFGLAAPLEPAGSCAASQEPIPDGQQLNKIVANPNAAGKKGSEDNTDTQNKGSTKPSPASTASVTPAATATPPAADSTKPFTVQNGLDAQALNEKFKNLPGDAGCADGEQACLAGGFAQCVGGKFLVTSCAGGTECFALPLVNSRGTSLACTSKADAQARISAAIGSDAEVASSSAATQAPQSAPKSTTDDNAVVTGSASPAVDGSKPFTLQNGLDAQALNRKFAELDAQSPCNEGENACVNGGFAQCVGGKFAVTQCAGGLTCAALPLVNSKGTSITCTTTADAISRIAATGASESLTG